MKSIFILYLPGYAGNFLTRLFSLGADTVPHLPKDELTKAVDLGCLPDMANKIQWYRFSKVNQTFENWQEFHRSWPDFYDRELFEEYIQLLDPTPGNIVYSIHPHEFDIFLKDITSIEDRQLFYVELDLTKYAEWLATATLKLGFVCRPNEVAQLNHFCKFDMEPISLTSMLDSEESFIEEYHRVCDLMSLAKVTSSAVELYRDWTSIRG